MFLRLVVLSIVLGSIRPGFDAFSVLLIVLPRAFVLRAVHVDVHAFSVSLVVLPISLV